MQNIKHVAVILILVVIGLVVWDRGPQDVVIEDTNNIASEQVRSMCYVYNTTGGDNARLSMVFTGVGGSIVKGFFDYNPKEKDSKSGEFSGLAGPLDQDIMARKARVIWQASAEGTTNNEELYITFGEGMASPAFGEMVLDTDGTYVYKNPDMLSYPLQMNQTDCTYEFAELE